jgi:hypothetical protein
MLPARENRSALEPVFTPCQERFDLGGRYWVRTSDLFGVNSAQKPLLAMFTLARAHLVEAERVKQCGRCSTLLLY